MDGKTSFEQGQDSPNNTKSLTINLWAALGILGSAILVSIVATAFTVGRTLNSDHFLTNANASAIEEIKGTYVRSDVYAANQQEIKAIFNQHVTQMTQFELDMNKRFDKLETKFP